MKKLFFVQKIAIRKRVAIIFAGYFLSSVCFISHAHNPLQQANPLETLFLLCTSDNNAHEVKALLHNYPSLLFEIDKAGFSPLTVACHSGAETIALDLIEQGAFVNLRTYAGHTPLMYAASNVLPHVVATLLLHGAKPDKVTETGHNALMFAVNRDSNLTRTNPNLPPAHEDDLRKVITLLLDAGTAINHTAHNGDTALIIATKNKCLPAVKKLLEQNAASQSSNNDGETALSIAQMMLQADPSDKTIQEIVERLRQDQKEQHHQLAPYQEGEVESAYSEASFPETIPHTPTMQNQHELFDDQLQQTIKHPEILYNESYSLFFTPQEDAAFKALLPAQSAELTTHDDRSRMIIRARRNLENTLFMLQKQQSHNPDWHRQMVVLYDNFHVIAHYLTRLNSIVKRMYQKTSLTDDNMRQASLTMHLCKKMSPEREERLLKELRSMDAQAIEKRLEIIKAYQEKHSITGRWVR